MSTFQSIILCATPRSGSTMLCDLMGQTGVLGEVESWYRRQSIPEFMADFGVSGGPGFEARYLTAVKQAGRGADGTFGIRVMWETLPELMTRFDEMFPGLASDRARLEAAFGAAQFVFLSRGDKVAQAVSRLRAEQSGLWHRHADGSVREQFAPSESVAYDAERISGFVAEAEGDEAKWRGWFEAERIEPARITYEAVSEDPKAALATLLGDLGQDASLAQRLEVRTRKLADEINVEWASRFKRERAL